MSLSLFLLFLSMRCSSPISKRGACPMAGPPERQSSYPTSRPSYVSLINKIKTKKLHVDLDR
ncbi:hypothetical protein IC575_026545 [Cucumis melo]